MRRVCQFALAAAVFALGAALPLAAQEPPGQQDAIAQLQAKSNLTDEDRAALRAWLEQQVQAIALGDPAGSAAAVKELREGYATGTQAFKDEYATVSIALIGSAYKQAKRDSAAQLIAVLNTLDHLPAHRLLIETLGDKRVPVRTAAAIGLRRLRDKLAAAGGDFFSQSIAALRAAGKREASPVTLRHIYQAMDYTEVGPNPPDPKANAAALLELLEARAGQYEARKVTAEAADEPGLKLAGKLIGQLNDEERRRLVVAVAKMLRYAVERYTSELHEVRDKTSSPVQIELRNRVELFIATAEELLVRLTNPENPPTVTKVMQESKERDKPIDMKNKFKEWADLLQERFQIDVYIAVTEDAEEGRGDSEGEAPNP